MPRTMIECHELGQHDRHPRATCPACRGEVVGANARAFEREEEARAELNAQRRAAGVCVRCGYPIAASFPMHVCKVKGERTEDGMGKPMEAR